MRIEQIRSATVRIHYAGTTFLTDPWLADKGAMGSFADMPPGFTVCHKEQLHLPMPLCDLPFPKEDVLAGVDVCICTHLHPDHIDMTPDGLVADLLPRTMPIFAQSRDDAAILTQSGFTRVSVLGETTSFAGVILKKTPGCHGTKVPCGPSCGVIFRHPEEKTLYVAGDTIWYDEVERVIREEKPDVIILNACAAELVENGRLIMDDKDVAMVRAAAPDSAVIVSHMDTVAHASITRTSMRAKLAALGIADSIFIPEDGESLTF